VQKGLLSQLQLQSALDEVVTSGEMLGRVLLRRGWIFEDELARTLAEQLGLPFLDLDQVGVQPSARELMPQEIGLRLAAIPARVAVDGTVTVAIADPTEEKGRETLEALIPSPRIVVSTYSGIERAWR
jgi:hypothetical protein